MKKKTAETTGQLIYAGPTITNVVKQYTIYTNGLPKILEEKIEEVPAIKKLIVPVNRLREVRDKKKTHPKQQRFGCAFLSVFAASGADHAPQGFYRRRRRRRRRRLGRTGAAGRLRTSCQWRCRSRRSGRCASLRR